MVGEEFLWNQDSSKLNDYAGFVIVGGFSYEDRGRAGAIASLDPLMLTLKEQSKLGKPILGICNGAQILVETGLVPGVENDKVAMALTQNLRIQNDKVLGAGFYNAWVHMRLADDYQLNAFTRKVKSQAVLKLPVAHGEGRFVIPPALLMEMKTQGMHVFQYCDAYGKITSEFPTNPNGSVDNIAAVSNKAGNVMAMMPHPERTPNGDAIFQSMKDYIESGYVQTVAPLYYYPRHPNLSTYVKTGHELITKLIITDNEAMSVENALNRADIFSNVSRYTHWEIECESEEVLEQIKATGVLFNDRKEKLIARNDVIARNDGAHFLVRLKDNILGQQKLQMLQTHFNIPGIKSIKHSVIWDIHEQIPSYSCSYEKEKEELPGLLKPKSRGDFINSIINSNVIYNPYAYDCYYY